MALRFFLSFFVPATKTSAQLEKSTRNFHNPHRKSLIR